MSLFNCLTPRPEINMFHCRITNDLDSTLTESKCKPTVNYEKIKKLNHAHFAIAFSTLFDTFLFLSTSSKINCTTNSILLTHIVTDLQCNLEVEI